MADEKLLDANSIAVISDIHLAAGNCVLDRRAPDEPTRLRAIHFGPEGKTLGTKTYPLE